MAADGEINMVHGLSLNQSSSSLISRKKTSSPSLELGMGHLNLSLSHLFLSTCPLPTKIKKRCLDVLGDPWETLQ